MIDASQIIFISKLFIVLNGIKNMHTFVRPFRQTQKQEDMNRYINTDRVIATYKQPGRQIN